MTAHISRVTTVGEAVSATVGEAVSAIAYPEPAVHRTATCVRSHEDASHGQKMLLRALYKSVTGSILSF